MSKPMNNLSVLSRLVGIGSWSESVAKRGAWIVAVTLLFFAPFFSPSPAMADQPGNWNLDDGAGHRLGAIGGRLNIEAREAKAR